MLTFLSTDSTGSITVTFAVTSLETKSKTAVVEVGLVLFVWFHAACTELVTTSPRSTAGRSRSTAEYVRVAIRACGREPSRVVSGGGSDANALIAKGLRCVNVGYGARDVHTAEESIAAADLERLLGIATAICEQAGTRC